MHLQLSPHKEGEVLTNTEAQIIHKWKMHRDSEHSIQHTNLDEAEIS